MDDNIKIYTPEKVKLKEATVVLTKLDQGDIMPGVKISEGRQTFRLQKEFENDVKQDAKNSDLTAEIIVNSDEVECSRDIIQRKKSVYSLPLNKDTIKVFSPTRSSEYKTEQKCSEVCNEETDNLTSSDIARADNSLSTRKQMKSKNSPFKNKFPSKHSPSNNETEFRSTSVPIITENSKGLFNLKQISSSVDTVLGRQSSFDMWTKDKASSPTKSFITDMVTSPHTSIKKVSQSIGRENSSIAKPNSQEVRLKDKGISSKEMESKNNESVKTESTLQKISVIGCSAYKTENDEHCSFTQKNKNAKKTVSKGTLTDDDNMSTINGSKNEKEECHFIQSIKPNRDDQLPRSTIDRQKTIPSILARSRSKIKAQTVRELLQREKSQAKLKNNHSSMNCVNTSVQDIPFLNTGKSKVLPTTIPPKRASTSMSVIGRSAEKDILDTAEGQEMKNKKDSLLNDKPLTKRYKNTRYSIPFSGPSMVIPKNYDPNMPYSFSSILSSFSSSIYCKNESNTSFLPQLADDKKHTKKSVKRDLGVSFLPHTKNGNESESTVASSTSFPTHDQLPDICDMSSPSPCLNQYAKFEQPDRTLITPPIKQMMTGYDKLPKLQVRGTNQVISSPIGSHSMGKIENAGREHCIITQLNPLNENFTPKIVSDRHQKSRVQKSKFVDIPVYTHPVVGNIHNQRNEAFISMDHSNEISEPSSISVETSQEPLCPAPSNTSITCSSSNQINSKCSGCFYCDIEKILQNIDNASVINVNDHAYTKSLHPPLCGSPMKEAHNGAKPSDFQTLWSNAGGSNIKVLTVKCGEHMILIPNENYPDTSSSGKTGSKQNERLGKTSRINRDSIIGNRKKRIMKKKIQKDKQNNNRETSRKLEFVKIVNLSQTKTCKQKQSNLEKVITCLKKQVIGNNDVNSNRIGNYYLVNTIQIERSADDVFTHINNKVCVTFYNGEDVDLKRWNEYDDYHVRLTYDNVSGAISHIECDTLKSGFYIITKTGMQTKPPPENQTQTMATLISAIHSALTILNDNFFIAVGKLQCSSFPFPVQLPANIQKHTNLEYLMSTLASITTVEERPPYFSDRSYLPKADAGAWYSGQFYDVFTRQYHNKRGTMAGFEKSELSKNMYTNNNSR